MPVAWYSYLQLRIMLTDRGQWSTAYRIEPQTLFSLVSGEKADNPKNKY